MNTRLQTNIDKGLTTKPMSLEVPVNYFFIWYAYGSLLQGYLQLYPQDSGLSESRCLHHYHGRLFKLYTRLLQRYACTLDHHRIRCKGKKFYA